MTQATEFVLLLGMERYSRTFFDQVEAEVRKAVPGFRLHVFEDRDTLLKSDELEAAISRASCLFMALLHVTEQTEWLIPRVQKYDPPVVFSFEGVPEVLNLTKVGSYNLANSKGMPKPVQNVARLLVGGREEDAVYGYLKLQKITSKVINFLPGKRFQDFRNWTNVSIYWNNRSVKNIANMFKLILREYLGFNKLKVESPVEMPTMGFAHPDAPRLFGKPEEYERWERDRKKVAKKRKGAPQTEPIGTVALLSYRVHILSGTQYHNDIVRTLEASGMRVLPIFCVGVENHVVVREWLSRLGVDVIINTMGFPLVGGPVGSAKAGLTTNVARELLGKLDVPYIVATPMYLQDVDDWRKNGVGPLQSIITFSLPEMDGAVSPVALGGIQGNDIVLVSDRIERLARLANSFIKLRKAANRDKKVAIVVYNYPPGMGNAATAALLDVPNSILRLLKRLRDEGYDVGDVPDDPTTLVRAIEHSIRRDETEAPPDYPVTHAPITVSRQQFHDWVRPTDQQRIDERWGAFPGELAPVGRDDVFLGGMRFGNVYIGVQPMIGMPGDPMRLLFDRENTPHHQYIMFYRWLVEGFGAHSIVHVGMHGTAEWMPGLQLGVSGDCWPDVLLGEIPNFYIYPINNPAEANIAKRRGYSTIIGHAIPPYGRAGLYKELIALKDTLDEYREAVSRNREPGTLEDAIRQKLELLNMDADVVQRPDETFESFASRIYAYLRELEQAMIVDSLHVLGDAPPDDHQLTLLTETLKVSRSGEMGLSDLVINMLRNDQSIELGASPGADNGRQRATLQGIRSYAEMMSMARHGDVTALELRDVVDRICVAFVQRAVLEQQPLDAAMAGALSQTGDERKSGRNTPHVSHQEELKAMTEHGRSMINALRDNTQEMDFLLKGLSGGYVPAGPGGDLIRDGMAVLPTGRNIHSLDPMRIPSDAAFERGSRIADALIAAYRAENDDAYPETIAQVLWGLDAIKTKGEAIGTILRLMGAYPMADGQGKIWSYKLAPLSDLNRPRIDVLMTTSGIFRDTFAGAMDMLDKLVRDAASVDEPEDMNYVRKHVNALMATGVDFEQATARIFSQASGTYGTYVDDAVDSGNWEERQDLEEMFVRRNAYAFGGAKGGGAQPEVLKSLLGTVGQVSQEIDSVEYGLTDMQHYYGYSGALKAAAERHSGRDVRLKYVESFTAETKVQELGQVLRMEYRTKMLNPKWYEGILRHGHNGAAEIANRFTYMLGWSATTGEVDQWVYDQAAETFVLDDAMRQRLEAANPEAARNAVGRLLEANNRGIWEADDETLDRLRELYADLEDKLEGVA